jgi:hypothetical protein
MRSMVEGACGGGASGEAHAPSTAKARSPSGFAGQDEAKVLPRLTFSRARRKAKPTFASENPPIFKAPNVKRPCSSAY